jgi:hypothetical protein
MTVVGILKFFGFIKPDNEEVGCCESSVREKPVLFHGVYRWFKVHRDTFLIIGVIFSVWFALYWFIHASHPKSPETSITGKPGCLAVYFPYDSPVSNPKMIRTLHFGDRDYKFLSGYVLYANSNPRDWSSGGGLVNIPGYYVVTLFCDREPPFLSGSYCIAIKNNTDEAILLKGSPAGDNTEEYNKLIAQADFKCDIHNDNEVRSYFDFILRMLMAQGRYEKIMPSDVVTGRNANDPYTNKNKPLPISDGLSSLPGAAGRKKPDNPAGMVILHKVDDYILKEDSGMMPLRSDLTEKITHFNNFTVIEDSVLLQDSNNYKINRITAYIYANGQVKTRMRTVADVKRVVKKKE